MKADEPSSTALLIGKSIVFTAVDPTLGTLVPTEMAYISRALLHAALGGSATTRLEIAGRLTIVRWLVRRIESLTVPGMIVHYILRKRRIAEWVDGLIKAPSGLEQLVVIGAGLDTLGIRIAQASPNLRVYEIDHPATQSVKASAFSSRFIQQPSNFELVPCDLAQHELSQALAMAPSFSYAGNTLFLAEGLFMYLTKDAVRNTISILKRFDKGNASFIFSYMLNSGSGKPSFRNQGVLVSKWLARKQEKFVWGDTPQGITALTQELGLSVKNHFTGKDLRAQYLSESRYAHVVTAEGENFVHIG